MLLLLGALELELELELLDELLELLELELELLSSVLGTVVLLELGVLFDAVLRQVWYSASVKSPICLALVQSCNV